MTQKVWTQSFSLELLQAIHDFSSDVFMMALFDSSSPISDISTGYTSTGEISGSGYVAGGEVIDIAAGYPKLENSNGAARFDPVVWAGPATFTYRKAMIYNASKGNRSIMVVDFGIDRGPSNGSHTIEVPLSSLPPVYINRG